MESGSPIVTVRARINRAVRDWTRSFLEALKGYGIKATAAFSMELGNGDDSTSAGLAQRYPDGTVAVGGVLRQCKQIFLRRALHYVAASVPGHGRCGWLQANVEPYLQFGEVQA